MFYRSNPSDYKSMSSSASSLRARGSMLEFSPAAVGGLSFSEFVEFIAKIAVEGMNLRVNNNYHVLFPTPFAKVLSILTTWGLADLSVLEDVRAISSKGVI